ncbi:hypothetical protein LXL04_038631 [Taraxacum kok-saghyz]
MQYLFLWAPTGDHASLFGLVNELRWHHGLTATHDIRPRYPQEIFLAIRKSPPKLSKLFLCHNCNTSKVHKNNRSIIFCVKPIDATRIFFPKIGPNLFEPRAVQMRTIIGGGNGGTNLGHLFQFAADQFSDAGALLSAQHIRRKTIGNRVKREIWEAVEGRGTSGSEQTFMVVVGVDEGDMEAFKVKELREFHHGIDVALSWIGDADRMRLFQCCIRTHLIQYLSVCGYGDSGSFKNSYIPENPRTPKPLTFLKNRLREAKNRSNTNPKQNKKICTYAKKKNLHICKSVFLELRYSREPENSQTVNFFRKTDFEGLNIAQIQARSQKFFSEKTIFFFKNFAYMNFFSHMHIFSFISQIFKRKNGIKGIMRDNNWTSEPKEVKQTFFDHFSSRFKKGDRSDWRQDLVGVRKLQLNQIIMVSPIRK